ncbi:Protein TOXD [Cytospora mali]|uniref:Protein TOXD n=1 Tax=Cytospora mali TaxID=578113 RepID=A0A194UQ54_CYTMA|nr:Protein TOXD [Valsa mali var. pyri (nom. inval.)]
MSPTSKAVFCTAVGETAINEVPIPKLRDGYLLVKVKAVALNPTDWKSIHAPTGQFIGSKAGCDYAGVVEEVGPNVTKPFKKGDRICGIVFGAGDAERGAFGEYVIAPEHLQIKIPDNLSFEEASTLGVGITTVGQGLYQFLELPLPAEPLSEPKHILIYGGSTTTGILGIQFARLSGLKVLATASPHNFDYLKSLGAEAVFDYHTPTEELAREIKAYTDNKLTYAWDCSPTEESARLCALALSDSEEGAYGQLLPLDNEVVKAANPKVTKVGFTMGYTAFGEAFSRGPFTYQAKPEDAVFAGKFWELSKDLLAQGKVKVAKIEVNRGGKGLEGVRKGLDDLKEGKVSGTKLVYTI